MPHKAYDAIQTHSFDSANLQLAEVIWQWNENVAAVNGVVMNVQLTKAGGNSYCD